jgi:hypothetical protein
MTSDTEFDEEFLEKHSSEAEGAKPLPPDPPMPSSLTPGDRMLLNTIVSAVDRHTEAMNRIAAALEKQAEALAKSAEAASHDVDQKWHAVT